MAEANAGRDRPVDILSAWTAIEVLSPQTIRRPEDLAGDSAQSQVIQICDEDGNVRLPWVDGDPRPLRNSEKVYYQVVLGTIDLAKAFQAMAAKFTDRRAEAFAPSGSAVLAVAVFDAAGHLVTRPSPVSISSFAWGLPRALDGDLHKLGEWTREESALNGRLCKYLVRLNDEGEELPVTWKILSRAGYAMATAFGLDHAFIDPPTFAIRMVRNKASDPPDSILLNSFFLGDLSWARTRFENKEAPSNLQRYLGVITTSRTTDLMSSRQAVEHAVSPRRIPPARWPGPGRHPLVMLQQAAVNLAFDELRTGGIFAVNGPPGTGKTTLLRDIVAGVVASRAEVLASFEDPADAFSSSGHSLPAGRSGARLSISLIDPRLRGFEILIASSNNKAVENVSAELPARSAIAEDETELDYFSLISNELLGRDTWGLVAAVLGNYRNREQFRNIFWWNKDTGLNAYLAEASGTPQIFSDTDKRTGQFRTGRPRICEFADPPAGREDALRRWKEARERFQNALKASRHALEELAVARVYLGGPDETGESEETAAKRQALAERRCELARESLHQSNSELGHAQNRVKAAEAEIQICQSRQPKVRFVDLLRGSSPERKAFESEMEGYRAVLKSAKQSLSTAQDVHQKAAAALDKEEKAVARAKADRERARGRLQLTQIRMDEILLQAHEQVIDGGTLSKPHHEFHLHAPWCNEEVQKLRDDLFVESMQLHKAFIDAAARPLRHNLSLAVQMLSGFPVDVPEEAVPDLWASLFLVVPAVSTTFASVPRMLRNAGAETLGWLLIDEAGQALPQAAVGALMRTQRAVVVGDPMQIEPVVTLPDTLTQEICKRFNIDPSRFNAPQASAQTLADAATPYCAQFESEAGTRTVGAPLLVHRRCASPMFEISNHIAYENMMAQAKKPGPSLIRDALGPSAWIHVEDRGLARDKWSPDEGAQVIAMLQRLRASGIPPDLYIVSPFVIVAGELRKAIRDSGVLENYAPNVNSWLYERVGTVHTVQGREAEAVIFVLGAPGLEQTGARGWAGAAPNLLNVAVTRAKEVLYVVGNRNVWREAGLFSKLDRWMDAVDPIPAEEPYPSLL